MPLRNGRDDGPAPQFCWPETRASGIWESRTHRSCVPPPPHREAGQPRRNQFAPPARGWIRGKNESPASAIRLSGALEPVFPPRPRRPARRPSEAPQPCHDRWLKFPECSHREFLAPSCCSNLLELWGWTQGQCLFLSQAAGKKGREYLLHRACAEGRTVDATTGTIHPTIASSIAQKDRTVCRRVVSRRAARICSNA